VSLCVGGAASWKLKALQISPLMHAAAGSKCASHQVCVESAEHRRRHLHHSHLCILQAPLLRQALQSVKLQRSMTQHSTQAVPQDHARQDNSAWQ